jgi:acyl carrier protein
VPAATIDDHTRFKQDLGLDSFDSFDLVELLIEVEDAYGVVITDAEAAHLHTVEQAAEHIAARRP